MNRQILFALTLIGATSAMGQNLYSPVRSIKDQNINLRNWGSGSIGETDEVAYEGVNSIRVSTRNFFQGGVMSLGSPVDLSSAFGDKNNMLRFAVRIADMSMTFGGSAGGGKSGGGLPTPGSNVGGGTGGGGLSNNPKTGGGAPPGGQKGGAPGGLGSSGFGGAPGGSSQQADQVLKNLRVIIGTSDGKKSEVYLPILTSAAAERNWRFVAIPLQAISGFADSNRTITSIAFAGDATSTFYVGEVRVINDSTPVTGDTNVHDLNLALGDEIDLIGYGYGGASVLKYSWDFDASDGVQVDAEGQAVKRKFRKPGNYKITLTIGDVFGLKQPYQTTVNITVNP